MFITHNSYGPEQVKESLRRMALVAESPAYKAKKAAWEKAKAKTLVLVRLEIRRERCHITSEEVFGYPIFTWDKTLGVMVDSSALLITRQREEIEMNKEYIIEILNELKYVRKILQPLYRHANGNQYNKWSASRDKKTTLSYADALGLLTDYGNKNLR